MKTIYTPNRLATGCMCAAALALAGCGSSASALDKSQLAAKGNPICAQTDATLKGLKPPTGAGTTGYAPYLTKIINAVQTELDHFKTLDPDSTVKSDYTAYVSNEALVISHYKSARARALAHDAAGMTNQLKQTDGPGGRLRTAARHLGWTECLKN